jgi:uncharacterized protein (DUF1499 family)
MASNPVKNPLPPCPHIPNCFRAYYPFNENAEKVYKSLYQIFITEAYSFEMIDPKRIKVRAVYHLPLFGFKDNVDVILEEKQGITKVFIRSASRQGSYDFGVNKRRVKRISQKIETKITN